MGWLMQDSPYPGSISNPNRLACEQFINRQVKLIKGIHYLCISSNPNDLLLHTIPVVMDIQTHWIDNIEKWTVIQDGTILTDSDSFDPKKETVFIFRRDGSFLHTYELICLPCSE